MIDALAPPAAAGPVATVLEPGAGAGALRLPGRVVAAIARQSAEILAADVRPSPGA